MLSEKMEIQFGNIFVIYIRNLFPFFGMCDRIFTKEIVILVKNRKEGKFIMKKGKQPVRDKIYGTQTQQLKNLTSKEYEALKELCFLAKNLYNVGCYNVRQHYFIEGEYLSYQSNYHLCKENSNYKLLNSNVAQQILKEVDKPFKAFFGLLNLIKKGKYDFRSVKLPSYLPKNSYFNLIIGQIRIKKDGTLDVPLSPTFKRTHGKITIKVPKNLLDKKIKSIRIIPKDNARFFVVHYTYEIEKYEGNLNKNNSLAIDLGVNNVCACVSNTGDTFLVDGKKLKSYNKWANEQYLRLEKIKKKQNIKITTKQQKKIWEKRNRQINDYYNKAVKIIMNYCEANDIGTIVVGYNKTIRKSSFSQKVYCDNFKSLPMRTLKSKLEHKCKIYDIDFIKQEESYTSQSDFLAEDILPKYINADHIKSYSFKGERISRGQYKSSTNVILNADINAALNILKKANITDINHLVTSEIKQPKRIKVS